MSTEVISSRRRFLSNGGRATISTAAVVLLAGCGGAVAQARMKGDPAQDASILNVALGSSMRPSAPTKLARKWALAAGRPQNSGAVPKPAQDPPRCRDRGHSCPRRYRGRDQEDRRLCRGSEGRYDPQSDRLIPGQRMFLSVGDAAERADIIAYLRRESKEQVAWKFRPRSVSRLPIGASRPAPGYNGAAQRRGAMGQPDRVTEFDSLGPCSRQRPRVHEPRREHGAPLLYIRGEIRDAA